MYLLNDIHFFILTKAKKNIRGSPHLFFVNNIFST
jgi:hypothetical protein